MSTTKGEQKRLSETQRRAKLIVDNLHREHCHNTLAMNLAHVHLSLPGDNAAARRSLGEIGKVLEALGLLGA